MSEIKQPPNQGPGSAGSLPLPGSAGSEGVSGPSTPASAAATIDGQAAAAAASAQAAAGASSYQGVREANKYAPPGQKPPPEDAARQQATDEVLKLAAQAGAPYLSQAQVNENDLQTRGTAVRSDLTNAIKAGNAQAVVEIASAATESGAAAGMNTWALVVNAMVNAFMDKNEDLKYDENKMKMYNIMGKKMSEYSNYMAEVQRQLDEKSSGKKKPEDRKSVEVPMKQQLSFDNESMEFLYAGDQMKVKDMAEGRTSKQNMVNAESMQNRVQTYNQQRQQLDKKSQQASQQWTADNDQKNQFVTNCTSLLKNIKEMMDSITRNL